MEAAISAALASVKQWQVDDGDGHPGSTCVIASSQSVRNAFARQFEAAGLTTSVIDANQNFSNAANVVYFATMHRAKGLEFDRVIVVAPIAYFDDPADTLGQRKLIYVAVTRAKREATLIKTG